MAHWLRGVKWRRKAGWMLGTALLALATVYALRACPIPSSTQVRLVVYAFSTQEEGFTQRVFPAFEQAWEAETGRSLTIEGVFGASGTLAGQINLGAPADIAVFSNAEHVNWLKVGKRVRSESEPVIIGCTPMIIAARQGNPLGIASYADLAQPGLKLLHADPRSSGAGEWGVLAEYGSTFLQAGDQATARQQIEAIWQNVRLLAPSARAAMTLFELGAGDALVTYEQDALRAQERGVKLEIVIPTRTVVAQHAAVVVDDNVTRAERPVAEAFVAYLLADAGQEILSESRMRPPNCRGSGFAPLAEPFTAEDLGGWSAARLQLVERLWQSEIEPSLHLETYPETPGGGEP